MTPDDIFLSRKNTLTNSDTEMLNMAFYLACGGPGKFSRVDNIIAPESFLLKFDYVKNEISNEMYDLIKREVRKNYFSYIKYHDANTISKVY